MPVTSRPAESDRRIAEYAGEFVIVATRGRFAVHDDDTTYSQTTGQVLKVGKLMRRWDRDALGTDLEGKPARFKTLPEAIAYAEDLTATHKAMADRARIAREARP